MLPRALVLALIAVPMALAAAALAAAAAGPDLRIEVKVVPAEAGGALRALEPLRAVATVSNLGTEAAGAFEVDLAARDSGNAVVLDGHTLSVSGLAAGATLSLEDSATFTVALAGDIRLSAAADPAHRINDSRLADNVANATVYIGPAAVARTVEAMAGKASGTRTLAPYSYFAFRIDLRDGDSLIFQADSEGGALFDCYLMDASNFTRYEQARESNQSVSFVRDYSRTSTDHLAYTAEPLPPGTYYLVLENDERLASGASPTGPVTVNYAVAVVNNSLPPWAVLVVLAAAGAAIYATIRWRPHFEVRSPLLEVPPPEPDPIEGEGDPPGPPPGLVAEDDDSGVPPNF